MMLGALAMEIEIGRLLVMKAAWELDQGGFARKEVSMAKVHVAEPSAQGRRHGDPDQRRARLFRDTVLEWIYRYARQARLVDGADEVHRMVLDRHLGAEGRDFWRWTG
jgi:acyl-CoA dehydrogenase